MSNDFPSAPGFPPPPPPSSGLSSGTKVLIVVGCVAVIGMLICCGGFAVLSVRVTNQMQSIAQGIAISDPAEITRLADEIAQTDLRADFEPESAGQFRLPVVNTLVFKYAKFQGKADRQLTFVQWGKEGIQGKSPDELFNESKGVVQSDNTPAVDTSSPLADAVQIKELKVRDKPARFQFVKTKHMPQGGQETEYWHVSGIFEGPEGPVVLMLFAPREDYTLEQLVADLEAIR